MRNTKCKIPFTIEQLVYFREEVLKARDFDALMIEKKALKLSMTALVITLYPDIEDYREKYLIDIYEPLKKYFNTKTPYIFWKQMDDMLSRLKRNKRQKFHFIDNTLPSSNPLEAERLSRLNTKTYKEELE